MVYPVYAKDEKDALQKAAGVFSYLINKGDAIFASAFNEAGVYWKDEDEKKYEEYFGLARKIKNIYEKKRNQERVKRAIKKLEKKVNPLPAFSPRRRLKRSTHPAQTTLFK